MGHLTGVGVAKAPGARGDVGSAGRLFDSPVIDELSLEAVEIDRYGPDTDLLEE